ncbi:hypothetical protein DVA67_026555 [Solirubrobacter sp. CPCC 204708]|uniref:Uncharacterized protein n=1 Tax=Solirubrobacter deserti TaxID=2282478 RepID=A0ABT4RF28_9ACTN|nr:hypothetical protein [Solirubrobacter deserti]MBE2319557.1 hypothetical protein [Solirubrobacter deserti]MDA0137156.1 hypothetical protein [Solirubrobacter deserti]
MEHAHIDITPGLDGEAVVLAVFDLGEEEIAASAHAVQIITTERFRNAEMTTDDVLEFREMTALADELGDHQRQQGMRTLVMRPSRLNAWRHALTHFVESRDEAEWAREDDRKALPSARALLWPLADLCADAMRAALTPPAPKPF